MGIDHPGIGYNSHIPRQPGKVVSIHGALHVPHHRSASSRLSAPHVEGPEEAQRHTRRHTCTNCQQSQHHTLMDPHFGLDDSNAGHHRGVGSRCVDESLRRMGEVRGVSRTSIRGG